MNQSAHPPDISIVVPVYNEHESLQPLHTRIAEVMAELDRPWELIYVDDGSDDGSNALLRTLQRENDHITVAVQRRNYGKAVALMTGFALARGDFIITLDSDLQDEPGEIPRLLAHLDEGYDIVTGWKQRRRDPASKRIPSRIANGVTNFFTGLRLHDMNSGLKAYRAPCAHSLRLYGDLHRYIPVMAHLNGYRVSELPVVHHERRYGRSKYGPGRLLRGGLDLLTVLFLSKYGSRPLHLFGPVGGVLLLIGFVINAALALEWLAGARGLHERPLLMLGVLLMLMGVQLLTMGLIAELVVAFMQRQDDPLATARYIYRPTDPQPIPAETERIPHER